LADPDTGEYPMTGIEPIGVPKVLAGTALPFNYGDLDNLETLFKENKGDVAAVMMEPLRSDIPPEGYLEGVKKICHANKALLIFDEVSCGWRTRIGGIQEYTGVIPDISVFAKSMSNGYPMGVVVGSEDAMELAGRMFISSSYWSDNIGLAASLATIKELRRRDSVDKFEVLGEKMRDAITGAVDSVGVPANVSGWHYRSAINFELPEETLRPKINTLFIQEMARRGIHTGTSFMPTLAHSDEDIKLTADAIEDTLRVVMRALDGELDDLLDVDPKREPFRRFVN